jgi:hypothetical protein
VFLKSVHEVRRRGRERSGLSRMFSEAAVVTRRARAGMLLFMSRIAESPQAGQRCLPSTNTAGSKRN